MAIFHGKSGTVNWEGTGTEHVTNWTLSVTADVAEATAMGDTYKSHTIGFLDSSATVTAYVPAAGLEPSVGTDLGKSAALILDTVGGLPYSGTMICTDISINADADGNPSATYSFVGNGTAITQGA